MIRYLVENTEMPDLDARSTERWIRRVVSEYGLTVGEITYIFCDDERILSVNRQFLGHDYYTDHIGFDYSQGNYISGDIYISLDTVASNAEQYGVSFDHELHRILIHGILHLTGQADKTDSERAEMTRKENAALAIWLNQTI